MPSCARIWSITWGLAAITRRKAVVRRKWKQRHITGTLDGAGKSALMLGAVAGLSTRADLASLGDSALDHIKLLVVDGRILEAYAARPTHGCSATPAAAATPAPAPSALWGTGSRA